mmetsp:Transcript_20604/g.62848  ORF Transcript_20604/g.62848 Transcript_20604/m.62848 type:complete len:254 (-) Transcript_20604:359-1120(-)|eukprot:scaffold209587_cov30-Tisochrysis_lutea.AAC.1
MMINARDIQFRLKLKGLIVASQQARSNRCSTTGKISLSGLILAPPFARLDANGREVKVDPRCLRSCAEVIWGCTHVDEASINCNLEGVAHHLCWKVREERERVAEQVQCCMHTSRLSQFISIMPTRLRPVSVEPNCIRRKKAECVKVCAARSERHHYVIELLLGNAKRQRFLELIGSCGALGTKQHGPLVQPIALKIRASPSYAAQQRCCPLPCGFPTRTSCTDRIAAVITEPGHPTAAPHVRLVTARHPPLE